LNGGQGRSLETRERKFRSRPASCRVPLTLRQPVHSRGLVADAFDSLWQSTPIRFNRPESPGTMTSSLVHGPLAWADLDETGAQ